MPSIIVINKLPQINRIKDIDLKYRGKKYKVYINTRSSLRFNTSNSFYCVFKTKVNKLFFLKKGLNPKPKNAVFCDIINLTRDD